MTNKSARSGLAPAPIRVGATATDVKRLGWRGLLELARQNDGELPISNHNQPQGVVLTHEAFQALKRKAGEQDNAIERSLANLSADFDQRLAGLSGPKGAKALRAAIASPIKLRGRVKAGTGH